MKLDFDEKRLEKLDEYNLLRLLEYASLGNFARGVGWTVGRLSDLWDSAADAMNIEPRVKRKSRKEE